MELLSISLDKFYKFAHQVLGQPIPENVLGKITVSVSCQPCSLFVCTFRQGFQWLLILKVGCKVSLLCHFASSHSFVFYLMFTDSEGIELLERTAENYSSRLVFSAFSKHLRFALVK